jgi:hypothetical protein
MTLPTEPQAEALWQTLEDDALDIVRHMADSEGVCTVENTSCTPARESLTVHGEASVTLTCDVTIWYYS